jgi:hypothetical protein
MTTDTNTTTLAGRNPAAVSPDTGKMTRRDRMRMALASGGIVAVLALLIGLIGCGGDTTQAVCQGPATTYELAGMTSTSDYKVTKRNAKTVSDQIIERAVRSCGTIAVGIANPHSEALVMSFVKLTPKKAETFNPRLERRKMTATAEAFVAAHFLNPLAALKKGHRTSPFLNVAAKLSQENRDRGIKNAQATVLGDTVAVELSPSGRTIDMRRRSVDTRALNEFVPLLKGGIGCAMFIGEAVDSRLPAARIRAARGMLERTFHKADIGFLASSSTQLPESCPTRNAR